MGKVYSNALIVTCMAVGTIWGLMWVLAHGAYGHIPESVLLKSGLVALLIALPTGLFLENQRRKLSAAAEHLKHTQKLLVDALEQMQQKAEQDGLTSVLNRETFLSEVQQVHSDDAEGVLLMIDADNFKSINDSYGHSVGDRALRMIADIIAIGIRDHDVIGRIGGEEFAVFLPGADRKSAMVVAERIRSAVAEFEFWPTDHRRHFLSISVGGAYLSNMDTLQNAFDKADARMYEAKQLGKNCCVIPKYAGFPTALPGMIDRRAA